MNNIYLTKSFENSLLDFDLQSKKVKISIAHFGNVDKVGDVIDQKAFNKTIGINKNKWHFINHNADLFVGKFQDLYVEGENLIAISELDVNNSNAKNLLLSYEKGEISEHSIGYRVIKSENKENYTLLTEIDLYEGSSLTVPAANPLTPFLGFKSLQNDKDITAELFTLTQKYFSKSTTSEEKTLIRLKIKQLNQMFINFKTIAPEIETMQPVKIELKQDDFQIFKQLLLT
jgi:uncharacterized protein